MKEWNIFPLPLPFPLHYPATMDCMPARSLYILRQKQNLSTVCLINSYSSALHLLARLQRTRSFGRPPYEDLGSKTLMKTSFQRTFDPKSSQG